MSFNHAPIQTSATARAKLIFDVAVVMRPTMLIMV
jgi:hypothetical protein